MYKAIAKLIGNTERTIFAWKKENRPIIRLIEKYFTKEDLSEFLSTYQISKMETLTHYEQTLNIEFNRFYRTKLDNDSTQHNIRFFWDFITRFKDELSGIELQDCKSSLNYYLLEYHLIIKELSPMNNEVSDILTIKKLSEFITVMQELSQDLTYFIIKNIKHNFRIHLNYLISNNLYPYAIEILVCSSIKYYDDKMPCHRELRGRLFLNMFPTNFDKDSKEFYYQLEDYFKEYTNKKEEIEKFILSANDRLRW